MKNFIKKSASILFTCLCVVQLTSAQQSTINNYLSNGNYNFNGLDKYYQDNFFVTHRTSLGLTTDDNIELQNCHVDSLGFFHCRYVQKYKGYPLHGPSFVLHGKNGVVLSAHGNLAQNLNIDVTSPISEASALDTVLDSIGAYSYKWQDSIQEGIWKDLEDDSTSSLYPQGELVIVPVYDAQQNLTHRFAWRFTIEANFRIDSTMLAQDTTINYEIYSDSIISRVIVAYVDAKTGKIVTSHDAQDHGYGVGTGLTRYDGWQHIKTWKCGTCPQWRLRGDYGVYFATTKGVGDIGKYWRLQGPTDGDNNWDGSNSEEVMGSVTAHWALQTSWEYFADRFNWHGSDGAGQKVYIYAQLDKLYASTYQKWGADVIEVGKFYDGYSSAALDIIGHEHTHNFIRRNTKLNINHDQFEAGALNEGYADIFGVLVKHRERGYINWHIGEDIRWNQARGERVFDDPHQSRGSGYENGQPAKYQESGYWNTNSDKRRTWHSNGGVVTHWFNLLTVGGTYNGVYVSALGLDKASFITFQTMMFYLQENSDYMHARNQTMQMAKEFFGICSQEYKSVNRAWAAVGVGTVEQCKYFNLWANSPVLQSFNLGTATAGFKVVNTSGVSITPSSYTWLLPSGWSGTYSNSNSEFTLDDVTDYDSKQIRVVVNYIDESDVNRSDTLSVVTHFNDAQSKSTTSINTSNHTTGLNNDVKIYPNPVTANAINIELPNSSSTELSIYTMTGIKVKSVILNSVKNHINLDGLSSGLYMVRVNNKDFKKVEKITIP